MEEWRDIPGYVGLYQASNEGRIRSVHRLTQDVIDSGIRHVKTILKPGSNKQGRLQIAFSRMVFEEKKAVVKRYQLHRIVFMAFHGEIPNGLNVLHFDGNHLNNRIENLYLGTQLENIADRVRHGTAPFGEQSSVSKLTEKDVKRIRDGNELQKELAKEFNVTCAAISHVRKG